jgi:HK97 family phage major capsid protein
MNEFKIKSADELAKMSADELAKYYNEYLEFKNKEVETLKADTKATKEQIDALEKNIEDIKNNTLKQMEAVIDLQGIEMKKIKGNNGEPIIGNDFETALKEVCKQLENSSNGMFALKDKDGKKIELKTVGDMTIAGNAAGQIPQAYRIPGYNTLLQRRLTIRDIANTAVTDSNLVEWVYETGEEGGAGVVAEGVTKTQSDRNWAVSSAKVFKITSYVKITKEMLKFMNNIRANIDNRLTYLINRQEEDLLLTGGGTTTLDGVTLNAQPLDNSGLSASVTNPNYWDVIGAAYTQIQTETLGSASPNAVFMNPVDVFKMVYASKTTEGEYIAPVTVTPNGTMVNGIPVIESVAITAGYFLVGDFTKFNIYDAEGLTISLGYAGNDFIENRVSIVGEKMLASFVMQNDYNAFVYDAFSDGITFLHAAS